MVETAQDNTDVNKLRRRLVDMKIAFKESMEREINRFFEEVEDLDTEIKEGMSNRVGSGFQGNEARKYAERLVSPILGDTLQDLDGIKRDISTEIAGMVGEEFVADQRAILGGLIGNATPKNYEQSELDIKFLQPPTAE